MMIRTAFVLAVVVALSALKAEAARLPEILLDPRVELGAALHLLAVSSGPAIEGFADDGSEYARTLRKGLDAFSSHPAVSAYARAAGRPSPGGRSYAVPLRLLVLCLDDELRPRSEPADCRASDLPAAAADLAQKADWRARMSALSALAAPDLAELVSQRDKRDLVALFERYAGVSARPHRVAPSPLFTPGSGWNALERGAAGYWVVTVVAPTVRSTQPVVEASSTTLEEPEPAPPLPRYDWAPLARDLWHEHGHGLLDPAIDARAADLAASSGLFAGKAAEECYGDWRQCVREHAAQAVALRLLRAEGSSAAAPNPHLPWQEAFVQRLGEYERSRSKYRTLAAFVPRLLDVLVSEARARGIKPLSSSADADIEAGMALFAAGKPAEAVSRFQAAVARSSGPATSYISLAVALDATGRGPEALAALDRAVELARRDARLAPEVVCDALSMRAGRRAASGDRAGAKGDMEEALRLAPPDWSRRAEAARFLSESQGGSARP